MLNNLFRSVKINLDQIRNYFFSGSVGAGSKEDRNEWERRAFKFQIKVAEIERIFLKLCTCDNRELVRFPNDKTLNNFSHPDLLVIIQTISKLF